MKNKKIQKNSGFTLVETLFAILILTFTITGLMVIVSNSLFSARYAKDEITVNYLLQEVVDYVRNDRDTTAFIKSGTDSWTSFIEHYSSSCDNGCYFEVSSDPVNSDNRSDIKKCDIYSGCPFLHYNKDSGEDDKSFVPFYTYEDIYPVTNFKRKIVVKVVNDEMFLTVTVDWKNGNTSETRTLSSSFLNWRK